MHTKSSKSTFLQSLSIACREDPFWQSYLEEQILASRPQVALHVAIFQEPFLQWILDGTKTVESRFSRNEVAPYGAVEPGDVILLKIVAGPIVAIARIGECEKFRLSPSVLETIRSDFGEAIGKVDDTFWETRRDTRFATLMTLDHVTPIGPVPYAKSDRRGWVVAAKRFSQFELDL